MSAALPLTPGEHEHSAAIDEAARWLATSKVEGNPVVELRKRWPLTAVEACTAIREAALIKARAA